MRELLSQLREDLKRKLLAELRNSVGNGDLNMQMMPQSGNQGQNNQFHRVTKLEFPKFGGDNVRDWMFRCEQFFKVDNVPDESKVNLISIHLYDVALMWHRNIIRLIGENVTL